MKTTKDLKEGKDYLQGHLHDHDHQGDIQVHVIEHHAAHHVLEPRCDAIPCVRLRMRPMRLRPLRLRTFCARGLRSTHDWQCEQVQGVLEGSHDVDEEDGGEEDLA